jgi:nicotinamide phosphoribosyltransferase
MIDNILSHFTELGYAAEFFVFGSGGDIMQNVNRDTMKFAIKCSSIDIQEEDSIRHVDVFKDPITDPGKTSKKGKVTLYNIDGKYITDVIGAYSSEFEVLETVYKNGELIKSYSMDEVRENINS